MWLLGSTTSTLLADEEYLDTSENIYNSPIYNNEQGEAIALSGGLEAMGVNFDTLLTTLKDSYASASGDDKYKYAGQIAYVQLYQILNAETEITSHPILLLGTAMGIREMGIFNNSYDYFAKNKMAGDDLSNGIYSTWCKSTINGLPNNGGGVIKHNMNTAVSSALSAPSSNIPALSFKDLGSGGIATFDIGQTYSTVAQSSNSKAQGYNKGAYGPMQIEADHWITWVCPYVNSQDGYDSYKGQAFYNIPIDNKSFDSLYSAQKNPLSGYARSIVTSGNGHLNVYRQNKDFVDNVMATVGHPSYLSDYASLVNDTPLGKSTFGSGTGYYFEGRFTKGQDWEDWVMSLEAWPHAFTCFAIDRLGRFCMFENTGQVKNANGEVLADNAWKAKLTEKYGSDFTFVNKTAENIYWTLEMLQSWNFGSPSANYNKDTKPQWHNTAWFYRELANYIAVNGTATIRADNSINPVGTCTCGNRTSVYSGTDGSSADACTAHQHQVYVALTEFLCNANGTSNEIKSKIIAVFDKHQSQSYHKNNYGYAVTGLFDAEANSQVIMRDVFELEDFNIFNYGSGSGSSNPAPTLTDYDYSAQVPISTAVNSTYFSDALFIGDSLTVGFGTSSGCPAVGFYAKVGATAATARTDNTAVTIDGNNHTIIDALKTSSFSKVYIMFGINDINLKPSKFKENYINVINDIQSYNPSAIIYIQSILPINEECDYGENISNDTIREKNNILRQIAEDKKCIYINVREIFENGDNTYKSDMWSEDGLHLNSKGYSNWYTYLKSHTVAVDGQTEEAEAVQ